MPRPPLVRNAADAGQVKRASATERLAAELLRADIREVLTTRAGRNVFWYLLAYCGINRSCTEQSSGIYIKSAMRDVALHLQDLIEEASPEAFIQMIQERRREDANRSEPTASTEETVQ